jgi:hypothetical protein
MASGKTHAHRLMQQALLSAAALGSKEVALPPFDNHCVLRVRC